MLKILIPISRCLFFCDYTPQGKKRFCNSLIKRVIFAVLLIFSKNLVAEERQYSLSLTGEVKYHNAKQLSYVNINAPKEGELRIGSIGSFDNLNPFILQGTSADGLYLTYETLLQKSLEEVATYYPLLCEYFIINEQENSIIFKIRKNAKFSDDSDLGAVDVAFSYDILKEEGHPLYKIHLQGVKNYKILGDKEIKFFFDDVKNYNKITKLTSMPILAKKYYENNKFDKVAIEPFLGSGAYMVDKFKFGKYISYVRNKQYWGKDLWLNKGRNNFAKIKYRYYREAAIAIQALKAGEYDLRSENIAKNWALAYEEGGLKKDKIEHSIPSGMQAFIFNLRKEKFQDIRVRKALDLAFDFEWINENLFYNSYKRITSFFENSPYVSNEYLTSFEKNILKSYNLPIERASQALPTEEGMKYQKKYHSPITKDSRENLIKARDLLNEAGWRVEDFKLKNQKGDIFKIEFLVKSHAIQRMILPFTKNLKILGIKTNIRLVDSSNYQKRLENFNFDMTISVFPGVLIPGVEQKSFWHSDYANLRGGRNLAGVENKLIDYLTTKISLTNDYAEKVKLTKLLDKVLLNNNFVISNWYLNSFRLIYDKKITRAKSTPAYGLDLESFYKAE